MRCQIKYPIKIFIIYILLIPSAIIHAHEIHLKNGRVVEVESYWEQNNEIIYEQFDTTIYINKNKIKIIINKKKTVEEEVSGLNKKYTGEKIRMDFYETDIRSVFRILRNVGKINLAVDKNVEGTVTLTLEYPVPWDQVFDLVLEMKSLAVKQEGNVLRIVTRDTWKKTIGEEVFGLNKKYTGEKIKLDFYETDIRSVFRILRNVGKINFVIDKNVEGKVTLTIVDPVPWDQVLELVLKMNSLAMK